MDTAALVVLVKALDGKSLHDFIRALIEHGAHPLPNGRWTVEVDGKKLGHAVTGHNFGLNASDGVWARWAWTQDGAERKLDATEVKKLTLSLDGDDLDAPTFRPTTGFEGNFPHAYLIVHFAYDGAGGKRSEIRFAGRMS